MNTRRSFLKMLGAVTASVLCGKLPATTQAAPLFPHIMPVEKASGIRVSRGFRDAIMNGTVKIYQGARPETPDDEWPGKCIITIGVGGKNEDKET